jgi:hypothetical protein
MSNATPLSSAARLGMRKDLVRLRMEMHRQQLLYHSQPLRNPMGQIGHLFTVSRNARSNSKTPVMVAATTLLALFGKRLGKLGKLARVALVIYPVIKAAQAARATDHLPGKR